MFLLTDLYQGFGIAFDAKIASRDFMCVVYACLPLLSRPFVS